MSFGVKLHCWGPAACFTRPEMKVERVSYDVITPSAARGVLEAIYWKPQIRWSIDRLRVLRPIRFISERRNEVGTKIPAGAAATAMKNGRGNLGIYVEEQRQQRAALMLRDVAYVIEAHIELKPGEENIAKHLDTFNRRARGGQCFTRPYFGLRECAADFALVEDGHQPDDQLPPDQRHRDLGWVLHDIDYKSRQPRFFHAELKDGVVHVPPFDGPEVRS